MSTFTIDELRRILILAAGQDEAIDLSGDIAATSFEELGYDSLALMEAAAVIEEEFGVPIGEEGIGDLRTPQELLDLVRTALATR